MEGEEKEVQHEAAVAAGQALQERFTIYDEELERVEVFRYLGRLLSMDENDGPAVQANLSKARMTWTRVLREDACPHVLQGCSTRR